MVWVFVPRFNEKTNIDSKFLLNFLKHNKNNDVCLCATSYTAIALYQNVFLQGESKQAGLLESINYFLKHRMSIYIQINYLLFHI